MSIGHPIPELWLFQNLTLKIQGQGHGIRLERPEDPHLRNSSFEGHVSDPAQASTPLAQTPWGLTGRTWLQAGAQWVVIVVLPSLKSLGIDSVNRWGQSHNVRLTSYRLTSLWFHVNQPSNSWDTAFRSALKIASHNMGPTFSRLTSLPCHVNLSYDFFKIWPWKSRVKVMGEVTVQVTMWV